MKVWGSLFKSVTKQMCSEVKVSWRRGDGKTGLDSMWQYGPMDTCNFNSCNKKWLRDFQNH